MAKAKTKENLHTKTISELKKMEDETQKAWFKLNMDLKTAKLKNVHEAKNKRKEIARLKTIIREKELVETKP